MSGEEELDSSSFNKNYQILRQTADWLSAQKEPDIDQLVPKVETAMKAYTICKDRLDKVQATLGLYFKDEQPGSVSPTDDPEVQHKSPSRPGISSNGNAGGISTSS